MSKGVLTPKASSFLVNRWCETCNKWIHEDRLAQHSVPCKNRWCEKCKKWILKDGFSEHSKNEHGVAFEVAATFKHREDVVTSAKQRARSKIAWENRFVEPLYEGQRRFEGGIRWSQAGIPGLGKKR